MAYITTDWSIDRSTGNIRYIGADHGGGSPSYATVIECHREWQNFADNLTSSGDDALDMTDENPSARSTDNIIKLLGVYNIDAISAEHIYDGSIIQGAAGTEVIYDGIVNFGNPDIQIQIQQNGAVLTDDWWNFGGAGLNADIGQGISHRFMINVRTAGADIDGRRLLGISRQFGKTFAEFPINGTARGNNVFALSNTDDLNNSTVIGTVATWSDIVNVTQGYTQIDVNNDTILENYYSNWDINTPTHSINDFYERSKYLTRDGSAETLYGISGELFRGITHEIAIDTPTGTFNAFEAVTWASGSGQMLAIDSVTAGTKMYIQLLAGVAPIDNQVITGSTSLATAAVNVTVTNRPVSIPFCGASTGSAIIGSYGLGIETNDLTNADKVKDLNNIVITPPNNVNNSVGGLVIGEDTILVAPWDGISFDNEGFPAIQRTQLSLNGLLNVDNITSLVVVEAIPSDTPAAGYVKVEDNAGFTRRLHYASWSGSTFVIDTVDGQEDFVAVNAASLNNVWIAYLDKIATSVTESYTAVYNTDRNLVVLVRDGGVTPIKQFISAWAFGSSNSTITAIRTTDE
jgi:hypothetical protein